MLQKKNPAQRELISMTEKYTHIAEDDKIQATIQVNEWHKGFLGGNYPDTQRASQVENST